MQCKIALTIKWDGREHMAALNSELVQIARDVVADMRLADREEYDIKWITCRALLKHLEAHNADFERTKENIAVI